MSDSLTCGRIHHHHNVDVQMLTVVLIQEVISQAVMNSHHQFSTKYYTFTLM